MNDIISVHALLTPQMPRKPISPVPVQVLGTEGDTAQQVSPLSSIWKDKAYPTSLTSRLLTLDCVTQVDIGTNGVAGRGSRTLAGRGGVQLEAIKKIVTWPIFGTN